MSFRKAKCVMITDDIFSNYYFKSFRISRIIMGVFLLLATHNIRFKRLKA